MKIKTKKIGKILSVAVFVSTLFYNLALAQTAPTIGFEILGSTSRLESEVKVNWNCTGSSRSRILRQGGLAHQGGGSGSFTDTLSYPGSSVNVTYYLQCGEMGVVLTPCAPGQQVALRNFNPLKLLFDTANACGGEVNEFQAQKFANKTITVNKIPALNQALIQITGSRDGGGTADFFILANSLRLYAGLYGDDNNDSWKWKMPIPIDGGNTTGNNKDTNYYGYGVDGNFSPDDASRRLDINLSTLNQSTTLEGSPGNYRTARVTSKIIVQINRAGASLATTKESENSSTYISKFSYTCPTGTNRYTMTGGDSSTGGYNYDSYTDTGTYSNYVIGTRYDTLNKKSSAQNYTYTLTCYGYAKALDNKSVNVNVPSSVVTPPPSTTKTCQDGSVIPVAQTCPTTPTTKTCPDGSVIPAVQTCPTTQTDTSSLTAQILPVGPGDNLNYFKVKLTYNCSGATEWLISRDKGSRISVGALDQAKMAGTVYDRLVPKQSTSQIRSWRLMCIYDSGAVEKFTSLTFPASTSAIEPWIEAGISSTGSSPQKVDVVVRYSCGEQSVIWELKRNDGLVLIGSKTESFAQGSSRDNDIQKKTTNTIYTYTLNCAGKTKSASVVVPASTSVCDTDTNGTCATTLTTRVVARENILGQKKAKVEVNAVCKNASDKHKIIRIAPNGVENSPFPSWFDYLGGLLQRSNTEYLPVGDENVTYTYVLKCYKNGSIIDDVVDWFTAGSFTIEPVYGQFGQVDRVDGRYVWQCSNSYNQGAQLGGTLSDGQSSAILMESPSGSKIFMSGTRSQTADTSFSGVVRCYNATGGYEDMTYTMNIARYVVEPTYICATLIPEGIPFAGIINLPLIAYNMSLNAMGYNCDTVPPTPAASEPTTPESTTKTCANGSVIPLADTCMRICENNGVSTPEEGGICSKEINCEYVLSQDPNSSLCHITCWDGSVIPTTLTCPAQYTTCANGKVVPVGEPCFNGPTENCERPNWNGQGPRPACY